MICARLGQGIHACLLECEISQGLVEGLSFHCLVAGFHRLTREHFDVGVQKCQITLWLPESKEWARICTQPLEHEHITKRGSGQQAELNAIRTLSNPFLYRGSCTHCGTTSQ